MYSALYYGFQGNDGRGPLPLQRGTRRCIGMNAQLSHAGLCPRGKPAATGCSSANVCGYCGTCTPHHRIPLRDRHRTRPGRLGGRTDNRPVPSLSCGSPQRPVQSPDGGEDGRPVHWTTDDGRMDGCKSATLCHVT
jgi:hypothetical protein